MSYELDPVAGQWYRHIDKGELFRVVSIDEDDDLIQVQYFDGESEELDSETWFTMDLDLSETPEDWTGPVDDAEPDDDAEESEAEETPAGWRTPRGSSKKPRDGWEDDDEDDEDDWDDDESTDEIYGSDP